MRSLPNLSTKEDQAETARLPASPSLAYVPVPANDDRDQRAELDEADELQRLIDSLPAELARAPIDLRSRIPEMLALVARRRREHEARVQGTAKSGPVSAPRLVTGAQGEDAEVVIREEGSTSPSRTPSSTPALAPTKPWEDASEHERAVYINRALVTFGRPVAISINFSPKVLAAANDNARGVLDYLRRLVLRHLKREIGARPLTFNVETTKAGKVHAHGALSLTPDDDPQHVEAVLARAGGNYSCQGSKPADVREMWGPDGWVNYCFKDMERTRRHLREALGLEPEDRVPLYSATDDIRALAKELHQEARRAAQVARRRPIAVEVPQPTPEPALPVSESLDAPAPATRSCSRPTTMPMTPLPIPAIAIRVPAIVLDGIWKASIGISVVLQGCPAPASRTSPRSTRAPRPVLAVQVVPIATGDQFRLPAVARSRGPPAVTPTASLASA